MPGAVAGASLGARSKLGAGGMLDCRILTGQ